MSDFPTLTDTNSISWYRSFQSSKTKSRFFLNAPNPLDERRNRLIKIIIFFHFISNYLKFSWTMKTEQLTGAVLIWLCVLNMTCWIDWVQISYFWEFDVYQHQQIPLKRNFVKSDNSDVDRSWRVLWANKFILHYSSFIQFSEFCVSFN